MKQATSAASKPSEARKKETSKGKRSTAQATGPKKQADEPLAKNSLDNLQTREAGEGLHGGPGEKK